MPRASRADAALHRQTILETAARLLRERGLDGTGVAALMAEAGLTHGGFYGHFASKEALAAEAIEAAFSRGSRWQETAGAEAEGRAAEDAYARLVRRYLDTAHRDHPGTGCPAAALVADAARAPPAGAVRAAYAAGVTRMAARMETLLPAAWSRRRRRERALFTLATLVGAIALARALGDDPASDEVLAAARRGLALQPPQSAIRRPGSPPSTHCPR